MEDFYNNFRDLEKKEIKNKDYKIASKIVPSSITAIIAPHGGSIEGGTSEIAEAIAGKDFNYYSFEGLKPKGNSKVHITSTKFDEPKCENIVEDSLVTLSIHGEREKKPEIYIGGKDNDLKGRMYKSLLEKGFPVKKRSRASILGESKNNIVNKNKRGKGVQLELSQGFRKSILEDFEMKGSRKPSKNQKKRFDLFVATIRKVLLNYSQQLTSMKEKLKKKGSVITKDMSILEIIDKKPEAIEVLFEFGLGCISCAFSQIETIEQGALGHGMSEEMVDKMIEEINKIEPEESW